MKIRHEIWVGNLKPPLKFTVLNCNSKVLKLGQKRQGYLLPAARRSNLSVQIKSNQEARVSTAEHWGQKVKTCRCFNDLREEVSRERKGEKSCKWTTITQAVCGFQVLATTSHSLHPRLSPWAIQSPCHLPTPTPDRTQMVWIRALDDWAVAADEILKSDSLLSLNTRD